MTCAINNKSFKEELLIIYKNFDSFVIKNKKMQLLRIVL